MEYSEELTEKESTRYNVSCTAFKENVKLCKMR